MHSVHPALYKSHAHAFTAGNINTVQLLDRTIGGMQPAAFTEVPVKADGGGVLFQNRTNGDLYIWYGQVPAAAQTVAGFKARAFVVGMRDTWEPEEEQGGLVYILVEQTGFVHHMVH